MTPTWLVYLFPVVQIASAAIIASRSFWKRYPALLLWLYSEVFFQTATFGIGGQPWMTAAKCAIWAAVIAEVLSLSRLKVDRRVLGACAGLAIATSAWLAAVPVGFSAPQRVYLYRSYLLIAVCVAIWTVAIHRWMRPVLERRVDRIYRLGAALWTLEWAISGMFVRGGLGYHLLPYTRHTWEVVNLGTYVFMLSTVFGMALAMWACLGLKTAAVKTVQARVRQSLEVFRRAA